MRLDPDCIREILFAVESQTGYQEYTSAHAVAETVKKFPFNVVLYHINQCEMYGFFTEVRHYQNGDDDSTILDLSPQGHEFIRSIRSKSVWNKTKSIAKAAGSTAIMFLFETAKDILKAEIKHKLGL